MKLVLASQGFLTDEIANEVSKLANKPLSEINVSIINECYVAIPSDKSKRWIIKELSKMANYIGGRIDFVNLRAYSKEEVKARLLNTDLIYIVGGKSCVLPEIFKELGFDETLRELTKDKVIFGTSAGAVVLGKHIESEKYWNERYGIRNEDIKEKELGLIETNIIPHYLRKDRAEWSKEFFDEVLADNPFPVYAINDEQALVYNDGEMYFVGGEPVVFGKKD